MTHKKHIPGACYGLAFILASLFPQWACAEDIDIFGGSHAGANANLVIVLDNAAAASASSTYTCPPSVGLTPNDPGKNFGFEQCGLYGALQGLKSMLATQKAADSTVTQLPLSLGLMYFPSGGTNGGQFVLPASPSDPSKLIAMTDSGISSFMTQVGALSLAKDKSNNNQFSQALQETFAFYNGLKGLSGTQYGNMPASLQSCGANYVVYITLATNNQKPQDGGKLAQNALQTLTGSFAQLTLPPYNEPYALPKIVAAKGQYQSDPSDEWSQFMATGQAGNTQYNPVKAYTIILYDGSNPDYEQLMKNVSVLSSSTPYYVQLGDAQGLAAAVQAVARQVMAANTVFAAPVLPISANAQGIFNNQVYMGMFRPDARGLPRWMGNLKQYQFGLDQSDPTAPQLFLADSTGKGALNSVTGFLDPGAVSFWTSVNNAALPDNKGGFWPSTKDYNSSGKDLPDGNVVEKGGVSQQIRLKYATNLSARKVYTCTGSACSSGAALSSMTFDANNSAITDALLGTDTVVTRANVINWTRGENVAATVSNSLAGPESSQPPDSSIIVRGSVHGDVLHSRPAVLNYANYGTVVFYGANDGHFRAVNGNQSSSANIGTTPPGGELWSFIPTELFGGLRRIYDNAVALTLGQPTSTTLKPKTYFFDGAPFAYQDGGNSYLFLSARRGGGGRFLYALDVTDPTNPRFMWKISNATPGFAELGQTWSLPKVGKIKGHSGPVLIFGGGYDPNQDNDPPSVADSMGRAIFVLDAKTGAPLWRATAGGNAASCTGNPCQLAGMNYSIPADITLVDRNSDGLIDRLYVADTGGNLWRVDLEPDGTGAVNTWNAYLFAALGGTGSPKRKFLYPPDVVLTKNFDAVVAVTGDREHPLAGNTGANQVVNRFYMIMDTRVDASSNAAWTAVRDDTSNTADIVPGGLFNGGAGAAYDGSGNGYYISLVTGTGEKGASAPVVFGGTVYFGTNRPLTSAQSCAPNLGQAKGYRVNFLSGSSKSTIFVNGGMPVSPVVGKVQIGDKTVPFVIGGGGGQGADATSSTGVQNPGGLQGTKKKRRSYWFTTRGR